VLGEKRAYVHGFLPLVEDRQILLCFVNVSYRHLKMLTLPRVGNAYAAREMEAVKR